MPTRIFEDWSAWKAQTRMQRPAEDEQADKNRIAKSGGEQGVFYKLS